MNKSEDYKANTSCQAHLILASQSPRRVALLSQIGMVCHVLPADIDETHDGFESPQAYVLRLAAQKARAARNLLSYKMPENLRALAIIAADTTVSIAGEILEKPTDAQDATRMLQALSGKIHAVHTAVALEFNGQSEVLLSTTHVEMAVINAAQIAAYIDSGEPFGKAGSYGIQGLAATWIKCIDGSYSGVMGLPIFETASLLRKHGLMI